MCFPALCCVIPMDIECGADCFDVQGQKKKHMSDAGIQSWSCLYNQSCVECESLTHVNWGTKALILVSDNFESKLKSKL